MHIPYNDAWMSSSFLFLVTFARITIIQDVYIPTTLSCGLFLCVCVFHNYDHALGTYICWKVSWLKRTIHWWINLRIYTVCVHACMPESGVLNYLGGWGRLLFGKSLAPFHIYKSLFHLLNIQLFNIKKYRY